MGKITRFVGVIIVIALLLSNSVIFATQLATADDGRDRSEETTPCEVCGTETRGEPEETTPFEVCETETRGEPEETAPFEVCETETRGEPEETTPFEVCGMESRAEPMEEAEPDEDTSGLVSVGPAHMVLEDVVEISRGETVDETTPLPTGWQTIMSDGFEGAFPNVWDILYGGTEAYWGKDSYRSYTGSYSAFCAKSGGAGVDPPTSYPNNMNAWMVYGPFSLADATDAELNYYRWLKTESGFDYFKYFASIDGTQFYGQQVSGDSSGWEYGSFDLTDVYTLGNLCGQPEVWIAFVFSSDGSVTYDGAFIDDVVLQKYVGATQFDLEAVEVYMSTQAGDTGKEHVVDAPAVGQDVYFHIKWNCYGEGTTDSFRMELQLDGTPFCYREDTAEGGWSYTTWCNNPWTVTCGQNRILVGRLDVYDDVSESDETNNEAHKWWDTPCLFDLEAVEVYLSTQAGDTGKNYVVDTPACDQSVYFHFKWNCDGDGTTDPFRMELKIDGATFCYREDTANGDWSYTTWCTSPWTATDGVHSLTGVLDVYDDVEEENEGNNQASRSWDTDCPPDLEAVEVYLSTQAGDAEKNYVVDTPACDQSVYFHIKWNCYGEGTVGPFRMELALDGTPFCYREDTAEGGWSYTTWCTSPWTATGGAHSLTGVLDVYDDVEESNEGNNQASTSWYTDCLPDLEAVEVYLSTQAGDAGKDYVVDTPACGQDVYFHFKWNCHGEGTTPEFQLNIELDGTPFCWNSHETGTGGYSYTTWCTSPWTATGGAHSLTGVLDVYDDVPESNETNNQASKPWNTSCQCDLEATDISWDPESPCFPGGPIDIDITFTVTNIGNEECGPHTNVGYVQGEEFCYWSVPGLAPGAGTLHTCTITLSGSGDYILSLAADVYDEVAESNEANNNKNEIMRVPLCCDIHVDRDHLDFECTTAALPSHEPPPSSDEIEMILLDSPPTPPVDVSHTIVAEHAIPLSAVLLSDVPKSEWTYGCTATSAGMLFGYYDRTGYPNMYTGPANGGVCPLTDLGQGYPGNSRYPIPGSCYIIATENGLDGISSNAHADDYWISYGSPGPDPWEGNWPEHAWGLCTADFLGTNQWKWDYSSYPGTDGVIDANVDGATTLWWNTDGSKLYDWCPGPAYGTPTTSCCRGTRLFAESRGYTVEANYNQLTDNQHSSGFTFAEFKAEIDAGRPVLIHVFGAGGGHTMIGVGYATASIYIHDTWDNYIHSMAWGGSYADMDMYAVTVIHLASSGDNCQTITVSNVGGGDLEVFDIEVGYESGECTGWLDANPKSFTVPPEESQEVNVCVDCTDNPNGCRGWLDIRSNDPDEETYRVTVTVGDGCGNMGVSPGSWSPTIICGQSDSQTVTVSASGGEVKGVMVSKDSGPTWLSISPIDLGDIPSGSSKIFTMTAFPPSGTSGDFPYTVEVSNTCGTPSSRDVTGTIHVDCPCGTMNVNPTSWSPTITCGQSDSQTVTVSASGGEVKGVMVSKDSGPTWLSISPTDLGDIPSGSSKTFTMTAFPPSGTSGDFPYTVEVSNTCGTPSPIDVTGTIHVDCLEPDLIVTEIKCDRENDRVGYVVKNIGDGVAPAGHYATLWVNDEEVCHDEVALDLDPEDTYEGWFDCYIWPESQTIQVKVCADNYNAIEESNEENNCRERVCSCNRVYLNPHGTEVEIRVDATDFQAGQIKLAYNSACADVTDWERNEGDFPLGTWDSDTPGEEWITFSALGPLTGDYLIGTLTIDCVSEGVCSTPLDFVEDGATDSALFDDTGSEIPAIWEDGTFQCPTCLCGDVAPYDPGCDGAVNMGDVVLLLNYVGHPGEVQLCCEWAGDVAPCPASDGTINMGDVVLLLNYVGHPGEFELCCG